MELDRRVLEIHSTLDSLKEEQSIMETAFEEKQKEIRLLREKEVNWGKENPEVISLSERLKQKEVEIEDFKRRLAGNFAVNQSLADQEKTEITVNKGNDMELQESRYRSSGDQALRDEDPNKSSSLEFSRVEDGNVDTKGRVDRREMTSAEMLKRENLEDAGGRSGHTGEREKHEVIDEEDNNAEVDGKEDASMQPKKVENSIGGRAQDIDLDHKDGLKQKMADNSRVASDRYGKVKRGHLRIGRAKRWRAIVKSQLLGDNGTNKAVASIRNINVYKDEQDKLKNVIQGAGSSDGTIKRDGDGMVDDNSTKVNAVDKLLKPEDGTEANGEVAKERREEVHSWTGRHIKKEDSNAEEKTEDRKSTLEQENDEDDDDGHGGYGKESDSDYEDEKKVLA